MLLHISGGKISSKTKIQKEAYFLSLRLNEDYGFKPHFYGPYSPLVDEALDDLASSRFIDINQENYGMYNSQGFEIRRYDYSLTPGGKRLVYQLKNEGDTNYDTIEAFVQELEAIGDPDYFDISIAAKVLHIANSYHDGKIDLNRIGDEAKKLGWDIEEENTKKATEILQGLGFVETTAK